MKSKSCPHLYEIQIYQKFRSECLWISIYALELTKYICQCHLLYKVTVRSIFFSLLYDPKIQIWRPIDFNRCSKVDYWLHRSNDLFFLFSLISHRYEPISTSYTAPISLRRAVLPSMDVALSCEHRHSPASLPYYRPLGRAGSCPSPVNCQESRNLAGGSRMWQKYN